MILDYIKERLCDELDEEAVSRIACCSFQQFLQIFSYIAMLWGTFFADGSFHSLVELRKNKDNLTDLPDAVTGGFDSFELPVGIIAESQITGERFSEPKKAGETILALDYYIPVLDKS